MKIIACIFVVVLAVVSAEPPRYRSARFEFQRQESKRSEEREPTTPRDDEAPYPAAGFKPTREFNLPSRQEVRPPATSYGVPADSYGAPLNVYSLPENEYGTPRREEGKETESEGRESTEVEGLEKNERGQKLEERSEEGESEAESDVISQKGAYYVLLPDSQLQRVQFQTLNDIRNMAYTARLQYRSEGRAPLYVYTSVPDYQRAAYIQVV